MLECEAKKGGAEVNADKLRGKIAEKRFTLGDIARELCISEVTLRQKMLGISEFRNSEIAKLISLLELTEEETMAIFFPEKLTET